MNWPQLLDQLPGFIAGFWAGLVVMALHVRRIQRQKMRQVLGRWMPP